MSNKTFRPYAMDQQYLLPPSLRDWLTQGHLALFVSDVVDTLDLSASCSCTSKAMVGACRRTIR